MNKNEIISICQQLSAEGKLPSVALVKARLASPAPMPFIIAGLKQWRSNPDIQVAEAKSNEQQQAPTQSLESRVSALEEEVAELKRLIHQLTSEK